MWFPSKEKRGNKCLCNETALNIEKRKVKVVETMKKVFEKASSCDKDVEQVDKCSANIIIHGKVEKITMDEESLRMEIEEGYMDIEEVVKTCSSQYFHGFYSEVTCGRILNSA